MNKNAALNCKHIMVFPIFLILCSLIILWAALVTGFSINSILGFVFLPLGILMLVNPIILIRPNEIEWKNLLGNTIKTVSFKPEELEIKNNKIYINENETVALWKVNKSEQDVKEFFA